MYRDSAWDGTRQERGGTVTPCLRSCVDRSEGGTDAPPPKKTCTRQGSAEESAREQSRYKRNHPGLHTAHSTEGIAKTRGDKLSSTGGIVPAGAAAPAGIRMPAALAPDDSA